MEFAIALTTVSLSVCGRCGNINRLDNPWYTHLLGHDFSSRNFLETNKLQFLSLSMRINAIHCMWIASGKPIKMLRFVILWGLFTMVEPQCKSVRQTTSACSDSPLNIDKGYQQ